MRRGNVARLPLPPTTSASDVKVLHDHVVQMTTILNQNLQSVQNRLNTIQQTGAKKPPAVTGLTVTGKQGSFWLTWNRIANVDGYEVVRASDSAMSNIVGRFNVPGADSCTFSMPVGNVAVTSSFAVYAYQGPQIGDPSATVTATTATYTNAESAPPNPPIAPRSPKVAPTRSGPNLP